MSLATVEEFEAFLGVPVDDQLRAQQYLDAATAEIRAYKARNLTPVVGDVDVLDSNGDTVLLLTQYPVTDVSEVLADDEPVVDYEWSRNGMLINSDGWPEGPRKVQVTYSHGYGDDDPALILAKNVCLQRASRMWINPEQAMQSRVSGIGSMSFGSSAAEVTGLSSTERRALDRI